MREGGLRRRDFIKVSSLGALSLMLPEELLNIKFPNSKGRGLIFIVGDGMPLGVIRAMHEFRTRVLKERTSNFYTLMERRDVLGGYVGTKSLSSIVTDSAPASVAWATGSKTANRMLACLPDGRLLKTIMELLKELGYSCGLVTTTRITHATPAAWVSHQRNRDAEDDIALEYLNFKPEVLLGGGNRHFDPLLRKDGRDLYQEFANAGFDIVRNRRDLLSNKILSSKKSLLGVFNDSHLSYYIDRTKDPSLGERQPTLPEMTAVALHKLSQNPKGFILQVEAGRIDHANHSNDAFSALMDTYELDQTLGVIMKYLQVNPNTLVIVTSDHGNSGWGINGTGPEYNHSTDALLKYANIKASFEVIKKQIKGKTPQEIKEIFEHYTTFTLTDWEAEEIYKSMQVGYQPYPGDFLYMPDALLGRALAHSVYEKGNPNPKIRRGNVGFTSTNHTAEDQIFLVFGKITHGIRSFLQKPFIDNTDFFKVMCKYFEIKYENPKMTEEDAKPFIKVATLEEWKRHLTLHIA
ncbi:MAG: alkaline phosphatase [Caldimicrobium sp.]